MFQLKSFKEFSEWIWIDYSDRHFTHRQKEYILYKANIIIECIQLGDFKTASDNCVIHGFNYELFIELLKIRERKLKLQKIKDKLCTSKQI